MPDEDQNQPEVEQQEDLNTHDLTLKVGQWLDSAFQAYGGGERFVFQMTVHAQPTPEGQMQFQPAVVFWLPGAMLGSVMSGVFQITNPCAITREEVHKVVKAACEQILAARSNDLRAVANGHGDGPPLRLAP